MKKNEKKEEEGEVEEEEVAAAIIGLFSYFLLILCLSLDHKLRNVGFHIHHVYCCTLISYAVPATLSFSKYLLS